MLNDGLILERHPLASSSYGVEEKNAVLEVVNSGMFTMGERVRKFEQKFAEYIGTKYAVMVNSGSSANLLMVAAYTLKHGPGTVVVPAVSWATSYSPFQQYGWKLRFVDIDRQTLNYDQMGLWNACEDYPDLILAVNLLGNPNNFYGFPRRVQVLEDNCESLGAVYQGKKTGSFGLMASHSFYFAHHISCGEGGAITTDSRELYEMLLCLRSHGWTRHLPEDNVLKVKPGQFDFIYPGYNVRPTEIQAALGLVQLEKLPEIIRVRRENASRFPLKTQKEIGESSWYGFVVFGDDVNRVKESCETRPVVTGNFLRSPSIKYYNYEAGPTPNADYIHDNACFIGNHAYKIDWGFLGAR